jgi:hypothetical protein
LAGIERSVVAMAAQLALIPVWFLSVYLMVAAVVPLTWKAWKRWGFGSFWTLVAGAVAIDVAALRFDVPYINFLNFAFVWLAIHQLGFAWSEGAADARQGVDLGRRRLVALACSSALDPIPSR